MLTRQWLPLDTPRRRACRVSCQLLALSVLSAAVGVLCLALLHRDAGGSVAPALPSSLLLAKTSPNLGISWIFPDGEPWGVQCAATTNHTSGSSALPLGLCVAYAHLLIAVTPPDPLDEVVAGSYVSVDGGAYVPGPAAVFETHVIPPANRTLVFTLDWKASLLPNDQQPPQRLCVAPWASLVGSGVMAVAQGNGVSSLPPFCLSLATVSVAPLNVLPPPITVHARLLFGNWSFQCSAARGRCRTMGHIAVLGATTAVVTPMAATGALAFDGGEWSEVGASSTFLAKFDSISDLGQADEAEGGGGSRVLTAQRHHLAFDVVTPYPTATSAVTSGAAPFPAQRRVCVRAWVQDSTSGASAAVNMSRCSKSSGCGQAVSDTVRCWSLELAGWDPEGHSDNLVVGLRR